MTGKNVLPEKDLVEKSASIKGFEYSSLDKELKKGASVAEKQYQKLGNAFESNKKEEYKTKNKRSLAESNLVYKNYFTFYKYHNIGAFAKYFFDSKKKWFNRVYG